MKHLPALPALLLFLSPMPSALAAPASIDRLEASVNTSLILLSDVRKFRETLGLRAQLDPLFAGTTVAAQGPSASKKDIVEFMIDERIITQQFPVADAEVEQSINEIQSNNKIDRATLRSALQDQGYSFDDYFELIRTGASKRNLIDREIRTKVTISEDDIKNYFFNHFARTSAAPISYRVRIISVSPKSFKTPAAARDAASKALEALRAGEPFEEVAKRSSDDATASSGGDLGTLTEDQMSPLIRDALKKLQVGQISEILGAPATGFIILKLEDKKSGEDGRLEKMHDEIRGQLTAAEYQHQITLWLERLRQTTFIHRAGESSVAGLPIVQ